MKNHSFMFLDSDFPDISNFCMRMEKNIVEGDGVDAVIWAGKIAERVTHYITTFINVNMSQSDQKTKLNTLFNNGIIPKKIYDQLDSIRQYRNIATHHDLRNEMKIAKNVHRNVFKILCYFYGTYKGDESYFKLSYPGITYQHDESFLNQIKNNISSNTRELSKNSNSTNSNKISLGQHHVNYDVHNIFNQNNVYFNEDLNAYTAFFEHDGKKITIGHFKTKEVAVKRGLNFVLGDDFKVFKHFNMCITPDKLDNGKYSDSKGIDFDEEEKFWTASFDGHDLGYFISENTAIIARKEYIDTLPLPEPKNGFYSEYKEISFDRNHKLWYIKKDGNVLEYYDSEREAIENLSNVYHLEMDLKDLGIVEDEYTGRWKIFYKNKYVTTCDTKRQAIKQRLRYISGFAQPKRNKDGQFSIHKGISYDEKNMIWILTIKGERLGFFDTEEDAFNFKKEFLKSKGFDVSNLMFHKEESFDESYDFKVRINSDENAVVYNGITDEWIVYFRGIERGRCSSELEARKLRRSILKEMPYPPRKSNGKYSFIDGIDYDINEHLWLAKNNGELVGYFDSEEDAFYGLKEALIKDGVDVKDMHFISSDIEELDGEIDDGVDGYGVEDLPYDESDALVNENPASEETDASGTDENEDSNKVLTYYDVFKTNVDNYILNESSDDEVSNSEEDNDSIEAQSEDKDSIGLSSIDIGDAQSELDESANIEEYKKSSFYGIAKKENQGKVSYEFTISDFDSDDEEYDEELNLDGLDLDKDNGFLHMSDNLFKNSERKDLKEIKFKSYDSNNFRREIGLSYNKNDLCISLEGMINNNELKGILFSELFDNVIKLDYSKVDQEYFSIFVRLHYKLELMDFNTLIHVLSGLGWEFDLLRFLGLSEDTDLSSLKFDSRVFNKMDEKSSRRLDIAKDNSKKSNDIVSANNDQSASFKENLSLYESVSPDSNINEDLKEFNDAENNDLKSKDYLDVSTVSKRKTYPKQAQSLKRRKSDLKPAKAIIRGGVRVSSEEADELDNAEENKVIKSNIIDKKPENVKEFKTYSLDSILEAQRAREEKIYDEDLVSEEEDLLNSNEEDLLSSDEEDLFISNEDESLIDENSDYISESSLSDDFDNESFSKISDEVIGSIDYGDVAGLDYDDSAASMDDLFDNESDDLAADDLFNNESDSSFEDELENISSSNLTLKEKDDMESSEKSIKTIIDSIKSNEESNYESDEEPNDETKNDSESLAVESKESLNDSESSDELIGEEISDEIPKETEAKVKEDKKDKKFKKVKKVKKAKKIPADAFDEKYANSTEIEYDEENEKWLAYLGGDLIKSFNTPKEAYIERRKLLRRMVRRPKKGLSGKYSDIDGIDFDTNEGLWSISINDTIIGYSVTEKEAILRRKIFADLILNKFDISEDEFDEETFNEINAMDLSEFFEDLGEDDLDDISNLSLKDVKKELDKF